MNDLFDNNGAEFSPCRKYRYALWRIWDTEKPLIMFIGLNPSTADEHKPDPTITRVKGFAELWGYGGFYMMNCFPLVSTNPDVLKEFWESGNPYIQNQDTINRQKLKEVSNKCESVVFAWGAFPIVKEIHRDKEFLQMFPNAKTLIKNKDGSPRHPLYVPAKTPLRAFFSPEETELINSDPELNKQELEIWDNLSKKH